MRATKSTCRWGSNIHKLLHDLMTPVCFTFWKKWLQQIIGGQQIWFSLTIILPAVLTAHTQTHIHLAMSAETLLQQTSNYFFTFPKPSAYTIRHLQTQVSFTQTHKAKHGNENEKMKTAYYEIRAGHRPQLCFKYKFNKTASYYENAHSLFLPI